MARTLVAASASVARSEKRAAGRCAYCSSLLACGWRSFPKPAWDTILFASDRFVVVPTLGAFVEGWLLIVSKEHVLCMGSLPSDASAELAHVADVVADVLRAEYSPPTQFEHGPAEPGLEVGCGVDHAHLHLVPLDFGLVQAATVSLQELGASWEASLPSFASLGRLHESGKSYLYVREPGSEPVHCVPPSVPCQFFRRIIADGRGIGDQYDYHNYPHEQCVKRTLQRLTGLF